MASTQPANSEKLAVKHSIEKYIFLNFANLFNIINLDVHSRKKQMAIYIPEKTSCDCPSKKLWLEQSFFPHDSRSCGIYELLFLLLLRKLTLASNQIAASLIIKLCLRSAL